jgi:DNA primase
MQWITAPPGAGKTRRLGSHIKERLDEGASPLKLSDGLRSSCVLYEDARMKRMMDEKPDLVLTLRKAGVRLPSNTDRPFFVFCPFHKDEHNPNLRVDPRQGVFYCFACGVGGDALSFIGLRLFGPDFNHRDPKMFKEVLEVIEKYEVPKVEYRPPPRPKQLSQDIVQVLTLAARVYHLALMGKAGDRARKILKDRRIGVEDMRRYRLGYASSGALVGALAGYPPSLRKAAEEAGLFLAGKEGKPRELLARRIIFPDIIRNGSVQHMIGRSIDPNSKAAYKYLVLSGLPRTIWGLGRASRTKPVILTESTPDAVNLLQMGFQGTAVGGTGIASYLIPKLLKYDIVILPQNDDRGREAVERWAEVLPKARVLRNYPFHEEDKDLNDQVRRHGLAETARILRSALSKVGITYTF